MKELSISEQLSYSTVRIECKLNTGEVSTGTGFFFRILEDKEKNKNIPVVITNKHVIKNSVNGRLIFTTADANNEPVDKKHFGVNISNFESFWRMHPDPNVDLCAMPIAPFVLEANKTGTKLYFRSLDKSIIPTDSQKSEFSALEEILMIGYPNGIWDEVNNKPIFRRGTTATHPNKDYNGKRELLIDAACFPGSSGSPVLIYNDGSFIGQNAGINLGVRLILLGVLYAGPQHTATGEIEIVNVPNVNKPIAFSRIPNNLGLIIKSERILEIEELFK
jgi:hypothetical protein